MGEARAGHQARAQTRLRGRRHLDDLGDEIRDYLERETRDNVDRGMTPDAARAAAHRKFGNVAVTREDARGIWVPTALGHLIQDIRYTCRILRRSLRLSTVVVATLSLASG